METFKIENAVNSGIIERSENVNRFYSDIRKFEQLTPEEESSIIDDIKNGDDSARTKLVNSNLRFIATIARSMVGGTNGDKYLDAINEGVLGMYEAIENYDKSRNVRFLTIAVWYIRRQINAFMKTDNMLIKQTNAAKLSAKVKDIKSKFFNENQRYPNEYEIADIIMEKYGWDIDPSDLYDVRIISTNASFDDEDETAYENSAEYNNATASYNEYEGTIENDYLKSRINAMVNTLPETEQMIISMAFGINGYDREYSIDEIAEILDYTPERIRQLKKKILNSLKKKIEYYSL